MEGVEDKISGINHFPRVLVCAPTSKIKDYCFKDWIANVKSFSYPNFDVFLADNTRNDKKYHKMFSKYGIKSRYIKNDGSRAIQHYVAESHQQCRRYFLSNNYEYMLHLETDIFPPFNIIEHLMMQELDVMAALYHIGTGNESSLMIQTEEKHGIIHQMANSENLEFADINFANGRVKKVFNAGLGCVLLKRQVLKDVEFRWPEGSAVFPDSIFAADLRMVGYHTYLDTSIYCEHRNTTPLIV